MSELCELLSPPARRRITSPPLLRKYNRYPGKPRLGHPFADRFDIAELALAEAQELHSHSGICILVAETRQPAFEDRRRLFN
jgi:hypothetical protein